MPETAVIRKNIAWAVFLTALLLLPALLGSLLQERMTEFAEVHNASADHIWLASDLGERRVVLLDLRPDEEGPVCLRASDKVYVYETAPDAEPQPTPVATVDFGGEDFCDGTYYRWDGSTLDRAE